MAIIFEMSNVSITVGDLQLFVIDKLQVHQNDCIAIIGKNGTGKTTLMNYIYENINNSNYHRQIGNNNDNHLMPDYKNLSMFRIKENKNEFYSGGEQTKINLAKIITHDVNSILLDEPTTNRDSDGKDTLINMI